MEFERKFLAPRFRLEDHEVLATQRILQYYVSDKPELRIRQVIHNDGDLIYRFTYKGEGTLAREEHEFDITKNDFENLRNKFCPINAISKIRYILKRGEDRHRIEVDVYQGSLSGLVTAEVEFDTAQEAVDYNPPDWFGEDITDNELYKNRNLYKNRI